MHKIKSKSIDQLENTHIAIDDVHISLQRALDYRHGTSIFHNILYISQLWDQVLCILYIDLFHVHSCVIFLALDMT